MASKERGIGPFLFYGETIMTSILALDTSSNACSVAVSMSGTLSAQFELTPRDHTHKLLPMIQQVLDQAGVPVAELDAIAFGAGPGSFTGLRIAAGVAQGLAFGLDIPVIPVSTLEALAVQRVLAVGAGNGAGTGTRGEQFPAKGAVIHALLDARMSEVYGASYRCVSLDSQGLPVLEPLLAECVLPPSAYLQAMAGLVMESQVDHYLVGEGWLVVDGEEALSVGFTTAEKSFDLMPRAEEMALIAQRDFDRGNVQPAEQARPTYLRDEVTWKKLPGR